MRAGERPWSADDDGGSKRRKRRGWGRILVPLRRVISIALIVGGLAYGLYSPFRSWVNDGYTSAKDEVMSIIRPSYDPVTAGPGTVSNESRPLDRKHPALMATDGFKNTYWIARPPGDGVRPELTVKLTERADLAKIIVHNGASDDFQGFHRPKTMLFIFDNGTSDEVSLKNTPEPQTVNLSGGSDVRRFKIAITDVYESIDGKAMALTEVELFKKR